MLAHSLDLVGHPLLLRHTADQDRDYASMLSREPARGRYAGLHAGVTFTEAAIDCLLDFRPGQTGHRLSDPQERSRPERRYP